MEKKSVLILSLFFSVTVFFLDKISRFDACYNNNCFNIIINVAESFIFAFVVFFFSLVTYFAPDRVFVAWWKYARIAIPVIFIPVLLINLEVHHSQYGELQGILDIPALILLYSIFSIGSIWQIWKGWRSK